jgi:hypothetical protein
MGFMKRRDLLKGFAAGATTLGTLATYQPHLDAAAASRAGSPLDQDGVKYWSETSLNRVYPNSPIGSAGPLVLTTCRNAQLSFQVCFRHQKEFSIRVRAELNPPDGWTARIRRVGFVPIQQLDTDVPLDETDGVGNVPGLVPDPLYPEQTAHVGPEANAAFWITLRAPADAKVGVTRLNASLKVEDEFRFPGWTGGSQRAWNCPSTSMSDRWFLINDKTSPSLNGFQLIRSGNTTELLRLAIASGSLPRPTWLI